MPRNENSQEQTRPQEQQAKPQEHSKKPEKSGKIIYMGTTMLERSKDGATYFSITYGTIYSNGLPKDVQDRMKEDKEFAKLFVPVTSAAVSMKHLMQKGTELSRANNDVKMRYAARKRQGGIA